MLCYSSITSVDAALVVAESTLSGIHDLARMLKLLKRFNVVPFVCVNMYDVNTDNANRILSFCNENRVEVIGNIPFNSNVKQAMVNGKTVIE